MSKQIEEPNLESEYERKENEGKEHESLLTKSAEVFLNPKSEEVSIPNFESTIDLKDLNESSAEDFKQSLIEEQNMESIREDLVSTRLKKHFGIEEPNRESILEDLKQNHPQTVQRLIVSILKKQASNIAQDLLQETLHMEKLRNQLWEGVRGEIAKVENWDTLGEIDNEKTIDIASIQAGLNNLATDLVVTTNEIRRLLLLVQNETIAKREGLHQATELACDTLTEVLENQYLRQGVAYAAQKRKENLKELVAIMMSLDEFNKFLEKERTLLKNNEASFEDEIIEEIEELFRAVRRGEAQQGDLFWAIERVKERTCVLAAELGEQQVKEIRWERIKIVTEVLKKAGLVMSGVALVAYNVTASNFGPAEKALSSVLGGGIIQKVEGDLSDLL